MPLEIFQEGNVAFPTLPVSVRHRVVFLRQLAGGVIGSDRWQ